MSFLNRILNSVGQSRPSSVQERAALRDSNVVVSLPRRFDSSNADSVARELTKASVASGRTLIVDCTACQTIDSCGIGALVEQRNRFHAENVNVVIAAPNERVRNILRITRLDTLVPMYGSVEEAQAAADSAEPVAMAAGRA